MGVVTCAGTNVPAFWKQASEGLSGIREGLGRISLEEKAFKAKALGFGVLAAREAIAQAGWQGNQDFESLYLASTTGTIDLWETDLMKYGLVAPAGTVPSSLLYEPLGVLKDWFCEAWDYSGPTRLVSTACSAGTHALGLAWHAISSGKVSRALVGGMEVLSRLTIDGFKCLQLLSPQTAKPFDSQREGINLAEGAAFLCLEQGESPRALAYLSGAGFGTDAHHMTAPHPEGEGLFAALSSALHGSELQPNQIDWVLAHGTGSPLNDAAESRAITRVFGAKSVLVSSTKPIHGHMLGATGLAESVLCVEALRHQEVLPTVGLTEPDPKLSLLHPMPSLTKRHLRHVLKTTSGFGGSNGALVFSQSRVNR